MKNVERRKIDKRQIKRRRGDEQEWTKDGNSEVKTKGNKRKEGSKEGNVK